MPLDKQKILRVNCPGFGHQSNFSNGCARPLDDYDAIVVNPISILHLFDKDPDLLKQIEEAQLDGMTSYAAKSDKLIESINSELASRMAEMVKFLSQGGLLIYFLCKPFGVVGPSVTMDNYSWLDDLAPDKPHEKNERHMASVSHGKNIEASGEGQTSPFGRYLKQAGLEWTTLIRAENLTEGYKILATAGPNKCVSAYLNAGENGGVVMFLPAPYNNEFDGTLIKCLEDWYYARPATAPTEAKASPAESQGIAASATVHAEAGAPPAESPDVVASAPVHTGAEAPPAASPDIVAGAPAPDETEAPPVEAYEMPADSLPAQAESAAEAPSSESKELFADLVDIRDEEPVAATQAAFEQCCEKNESEQPSQSCCEVTSHVEASEVCSSNAKPVEVVESCCAKADEEVACASSQQSAESVHVQADQRTNHRDEMKHHAKEERDTSGAADEIIPRAKDLIEKMEEISKAPLPDWCQKYSFADLDKLRDELAELNETIRQTQQKIEKAEGKIRSMESLKNALLTADGDELYQACSRVFEQLGWKVEPSPSLKGEFYLLEGDSTAAIVRVLRTASKPKNADVAALAESIISYWGEHEEEPKGVLLASTYANRPPAERTEEDYSDGITDFAAKKNLCLMTSLQLLSIYRDLEASNSAARELKDKILSTNGRLSGCTLEQRMAASAT